MTFVKGDPRINREGKKPGTTNHDTTRMKRAFAMLIENNLDEMTTWLEQIAATDPAKAMDIVIKLSERFVPKLAQTQLTDGEGGDLFKNIHFRFGDEQPQQLDEQE